jgi:hypothetical protein
MHFTIRVNMALTTYLLGNAHAIQQLLIEELSGSVQFLHMVRR